MAWLECLAGQALDDEDDAVRRAGGSAGRFAPDEGLWKETRTRVAAGVPQKPGARRACCRWRLMSRLLHGFLDMPPSIRISKRYNFDL